MNIFTSFFSQFYAKPATREDIERDLMRKESQIGRQLFGPIPSGTRREFFRLDEKTWIWHEERGGRAKVTRYMVTKTEVLKSVDGGQYRKVGKKETDHLYYAAKTYVKRVNSELYGAIVAV